MKKYILISFFILILIVVGGIIFVKYNAVHPNVNKPANLEHLDEIGFIFSYPLSLQSKPDIKDYRNGKGQAYQNGIDYNIFLSDSNENILYSIDAYSDDFTDWLVEKTTYDLLRTQCNEKNDYIIGCKELKINGIPMLMVSKKEEIEGSLFFDNFVIFRNENSDYKNVLIYLRLPALTKNIDEHYDATINNADLSNKVYEYGKNLLAEKYENFDLQDQKVIKGFNDLLTTIKLK